MVDESQESKEKEKKAFIIGPIGPVGSDQRLRIDSYLQFVYKPILKDLGYSQALASHEEPDPGSIMSKIVDHLVNDDLVICDLTELNANVLYELGIRHCYHKRVILVSEDGKPPFDLSQDRTIPIRKFPAGMMDLKIELPKTVEAVEKSPIPDNPVSRYFSYLPYNKISELETDPEKEFKSFVINRLQSIERSIDNVSQFSTQINVKRRKSLADIYTDNADNVASKTFNSLIARHLSSNENYYNPVNFPDSTASIYQLDYGENVILSSKLKNIILRNGGMVADMSQGTLTFHIDPSKVLKIENEIYEVNKNVKIHQV